MDPHHWTDTPHHCIRHASISCQVLPQWDFELGCTVVAQRTDSTEVVTRNTYAQDVHAPERAESGGIGEGCVLNWRRRLWVACIGNSDFLPIVLYRRNGTLRMDGHSFFGCMIIQHICED